MRDASAYYHAGARLVSVTEALRIAGMRSFEHVTPDVLAKAAARGSAVHEFLELLDLGLVEPNDAPAEIDGYVRAYVTFGEESHFEVREVEQSVVELTHGFAGTLDRAGHLNGRFSILDLKCVSSLDDATGLQLAGYGIARGVTTNGDRYALQLRPDGTYRLKRYESRQDIHDFLACVRVARWRLERGLASLEDL